VSIVLVATAVGAILGPNLIKLTGALARNLGFPGLAGPFMLAAVAYVSGALVLWVLLRPDPLLLARSLAAAEISKEREVTTEAPPASAGRRWSWPLASGAGIMIITQLIMVAIMTMTPIHIEHHGHGIGITGIVIGAHVAGMFLPSPLSGWLVDRFGYLSISVDRNMGTGRFSVHTCVGPRAARGGMEPWSGQRHHAGDRRRAVGYARAPRA
jgi:drug/metabolite transporter superfamily protein YnfA